MRLAYNEWLDDFKNEQLCNTAMTNGVSTRGRLICFFGADFDAY